MVLVQKQTNKQNNGTQKRPWKQTGVYMRTGIYKQDTTNRGSIEHVLVCCVINCPKTLRLKSIISIISASVGQEFRSGLAGGFWHGVYHAVVVKTARAAGIWSHGLVWRICFWEGCSHGWKFQVSNSCHLDLSMGLLECPYNMAAGFSTTNDTRARWRPQCVLWSNFSHLVW